jgi:serine/threonine-protein kinase
MVQPSKAPLGELRFDRLAEIAVGETASVELCRVRAGPSKGQLVAVKRLHRHIAEDPQFLAMFRDEVWMSAALKHENVVGVTGWGNDEHGLYLAVELVRGVSMARLMKTVFETGERFTERQVVFLGKCICDGLAAAHSLRSETGEHLHLVHRDLTPGNVLLSFDGKVKITDFGLAKAKQRLTRTLTGLLKGQPQYMSPEQIRRALLGAPSLASGQRPRCHARSVGEAARQSARVATEDRQGAGRGGQPLPREGPGQSLPERGRAEQTIRRLAGGARLSRRK